MVGPPVRPPTVPATGSTSGQKPKPTAQVGPTLSGASTATTASSTKSGAVDAKGPNSKSKAGPKSGVDRKSTSKKCGLTLPVGRIARQLRVQRFTKRVSVTCAIYLTAVIEYLTAEILEVAGKQTLDANKLRMIPRHIQLAIRSDGELNRLLEGVTIASGGVPVTCPAHAEPRKRPKKAKTSSNKQVDEYDDSQEF